jgi:hypothetical protein
MTDAEPDGTGFRILRRAGNSDWERITTRPIVGGPPYAYVDPDPTPGIRYQYLLETQARSGDTERFGPVDIQIPLAAVLSLGAVPNPASGAVGIHYSLPAAARVSVRVFDPTGRLVRVLVEESFHRAGPHEVIWNARNDSGRKLPAGIYFYQLRAPGSLITHKLVLLD